MIASDGEAICGVWFYDQKHFPSTDFIVNDDLAIFNKATGWLDDYFKGKNPQVDFKIKAHGSQFRQKVWKILSEIPYGETMTYGEIASRISPTMSPQAVGGAVGHNPISCIDHVRLNSFECESVIRRADPPDILRKEPFRFILKKHTDAIAVERPEFPFETKLLSHNRKIIARESKR